MDLVSRRLVDSRCVSAGMQVRMTETGLRHRQREQAAAKPVAPESSSSGAASPLGKKAKRKPGRPRKPKNLSIHQLYRKRQRRRPSRCNLLDVPWDQYYSLVKQIESKILDERDEIRRTPLKAPSTRNVEDHATPPTWGAQLREFGAWIQETVCELPGNLGDLLRPRPRGDPSSAHK